MAIIINGMDMPEKCADCPLWRADGDFCCIPSVSFDINPYGERKLDDCPLTEQKNEIDELMARALTPEWQKAHMDMGFLSPLGEVYKALGVYDDG